MVLIARHVNENCPEAPRPANLKRPTTLDEVLFE
jgi:hypothetical protein